MITEQTNKQLDRLPSSVFTMILVRQQPVKCCPATDRLVIVTTKTHIIMLPPGHHESIISFSSGVVTMVIVVIATSIMQCYCYLG